MRHPRRLALAMPLLLAAAGCAGMQADTASPTARFAATLEASDPAVDGSITVMDSFERRALREESAVAFALGRIPAPGGADRRAGQAPPAPPAASAVEAAGQVIAPAFTALGDYAHVLGGDDPRPSSGPEVLSQAVAQALPRTSTPIDPAVAEAGIAGVAALARMAQAGGGRGPAQALAQQAQPHVAAVSRLLKAVIGPQSGQATRGVIRARREAMEAAHIRLLEAARREPGLGAAGRYGLYHQVSALRDQDPLPGTLAAIVTLLSAMEEAHAAIAAGDPAAEGKVAVFEATLASLTALTDQDSAPAGGQ